MRDSRERREGSGYGVAGECATAWTEAQLAERLERGAVVEHLDFGELVRPARGFETRDQPLLVGIRPVCRQAARRGNRIRGGVDDRLTHLQEPVALAPSTG